MKVLLVAILCVVALFQLPEAQAQNAPICDFCQFAVKFIEGYLAENATEQQIVKALDLVCALAPSSFSQQCRAFVQQEVPVIIQYLENNQNPATICSELNLCSSMKMKSFAQATTGKCELCSALVAYGEQLVKSGNDDQTILRDLDQQCDVLGRLWGSGTSSQCKQFVAQYVPMIRKEANKTPSEICKSFGIC